MRRYINARLNWLNTKYELEGIQLKIIRTKEIEMKGDRYI